MNKVLLFFKNWFINMGAGALLDEAGKLGDEALERYYARKPKTCAALVSSFYCWIPDLIELTAKTDTPLDDKAVAEIKQELEEFAARHDIPLIDLDAE